MTESIFPPLIQSLCDPDMHGSDQRVRVVETHISWVLLTGEYAYKIKKPVDLGFLDFSTLELRHKYCEEEMRLNRRLAPSLYLGVTAITGEPGHPSFGAEGPVLEYAVKLKQFDEDCLADRLIGKNKLTPEHIDALAQTLAAFHAQASRATDEDRHGLPETILAAAEHNFDHLQRQTLPARGNSIELNPMPSPPAPLPLAGEGSKSPSPLRGEGLGRGVREKARMVTTSHRQADHVTGSPPVSFAAENNSNAQLAALLSWTETEFERLREVFRARKKSGFIRECHGDLHCGNLVLIDGRLMPFDCIEFSEDLRWIDCISEIAFVHMDIEARGRPDLAWRLLNRYLEISGDYAGLEVFNFYRVYRAMVRAKVNDLCLEHTTETSERLRLEGLCRRYLDHAQWISQPKVPVLSITHGYSGSGKSRFASRLVERLPAIRIASDIERKRLAGFAALDDTQSSQSSGIYSQAFTRRTYALLFSQAERLLRAGINVVLDATFLKAECRRASRELAVRLGVRFYILDLRAPEAVLRERIARRLSLANDPSEAGQAVLTRQIADADPLEKSEEPFVLALEASADPDVDAVLRKLA